MAGWFPLQDERSLLSSLPILQTKVKPDFYDHCEPIAMWIRLHSRRSSPVQEEISPICGMIENKGPKQPSLKRKCFFWYCNYARYNTRSSSNQQCTSTLIMWFIMGPVHEINRMISVDGGCTPLIRSERSDNSRLLEGIQYNSTLNIS